MNRASLLDEICPLVPERRAFAVIDAARDPRIHRAVAAADCNHVSLYRGDAAARMATVAPYLVQLDRDARFTRWLLEQGWGKSWAVFVNAQTSIDALCGHFRHFLMARLPDQRVVYFRFYDPRILRAFVPTCTPGELAALFGPVERFIIESDDPARGFAFELARGELVWSRFSDPSRGTPEE